jgi:transcriptional regulator
MYDVAAFRESRVDVMHALIKAHPLATLVTHSADGLEANHIPLLVDAQPTPYGTLLGHVARANPLWQKAGTTGDVLAVFQGAQGYITPSWYASKAQHGKVVPTWNYVTVHAHGPLVVHDDAEWLRALVTRLTDSQEARRDAPWQVTDAPTDYVGAMLKAIVGIEVPIRRLQGKWKMSQNRLPQDRNGVMDNLAAQGDAASMVMLEAIRR